MGSECFVEEVESRGKKVVQTNTDKENSLDKGYLGRGKVQRKYSYGVDEQEVGPT